MGAAPPYPSSGYLRTFIAPTKNFIVTCRAHVILASARDATDDALPLLGRDVVRARCECVQLLVHAEHMQEISSAPNCAVGSLAGGWRGLSERARASVPVFAAVGDTGAAAAALESAEIAFSRACALAAPGAFHQADFQKAWAFSHYAAQKIPEWVEVEQNNLAALRARGMDPGCVTQEDVAAWLPETVRIAS